MRAHAAEGWTYPPFLLVVLPDGSSLWQYPDGELRELGKRLERVAKKRAEREAKEQAERAAKEQHKFAAKLAAQRLGLMEAKRKSRSKIAAIEGMLQNAELVGDTIAV